MSIIISPATVLVRVSTFRRSHPDEVPCHRRSSMRSGSVNPVRRTGYILPYRYELGRGRGLHTWIDDHERNRGRCSETLLCCTRLLYQTCSRLLSLEGRSSGCINDAVCSVGTVWRLLYEPSEPCPPEYPRGKNTPLCAS